MTANDIIDRLKRMETRLERLERMVLGLGRGLALGSGASCIRGIYDELKLIESEHEIVRTDAG